MRCPECEANGYSRKTRTPEWRCRKCGHEWDTTTDGWDLLSGTTRQPYYDAPTIDYKALGYSDKEHYEYITGFDARIREEQRARIKIKDEERARRLREEELRRNPPPPPEEPEPTPNADSDGPKENYFIQVGRIAPPILLFGAIIFFIFFSALSRPSGDPYGGMPERPADSYWQDLYR